MNESKATTANPDQTRLGMLVTTFSRGRLPEETPAVPRERMGPHDSVRKRSPIYLQAAIGQLLLILCQANSGLSPETRNVLPVSILSPVRFFGRLLGIGTAGRPGSADDGEVFQQDRLTPQPMETSGHRTPGLDSHPEVDQVVRLTDERIRSEALRQLDLLDLDDINARIEPLWALASGITDTNGDEDDEPINGFLDLPPTRCPRASDPGSERF